MPYIAEVIIASQVMDLQPLVITTSSFPLLILVVVLSAAVITYIIAY
jgi:hypothetical protein